MEQKTKSALLLGLSAILFGAGIGILVGDNLPGSDDVTQPLAFSCSTDPSEPDAWIVRYYWLASAIQSQADAGAWELTWQARGNNPPTRTYYRQPEHVVCNVYPMPESKQ